jgi:beta-glucosidase
VLSLTMSQRCAAMAAVLLVVASCPFPLVAQQRPAKAPYLDPALPAERRADDLVSRMTLEEKISQMMNAAPAISRLGIPEYDWWNEALHGVAFSGVATVFPQAIGLGATFDPDLVGRVAAVISTEARAKYNEAQRQGNHGRFYWLTFWSPNINIFRDPRWGRGQETYGEDSYLTSRLGVAFVRGLQGNDPKYLKVVSTPKHYAVHSGPEPLRHGFDAAASDRDLRETYLPAFRATVIEGKAASVMCAYNRVNGQPCCENTRLLANILRGEWGFGGYVVSDCGAVGDIFANHKVAPSQEAASARAVKAGTDLDCGEEYATLLAAVKQGLISEAEIDRAVKRLFVARFRLGMFDPPEMVPFAKIPLSENNTAEHRRLAADAARESMVLLKNDGILPLRKDLGTIAVIGPNADDVDVLLGNYNGFPSHTVTPLEGIRRAVSEKTKVISVRGAALTSVEALPIPSSSLTPAGGAAGEHGLRAEYFANRDLSGTPALTRVDPEVSFDWGVGSPAAEIPVDNFSARWTGKLVAPVSGTYALGATADDGVRVYLDGKLIAEDWTQHAPRTVTGPVTLEAGRAYDVKIEYFEGGVGAVAKFVWMPPSSGENRFAEAVDAAKRADAVVMVLGISSKLEGEEMNVTEAGFKGGDRTSIDLPERQQRLLEAVAATGKPIVVVLLSGSALAVNWAADHANAILHAWYPGEEGGTAVADVLFGDYNPAGRLPVTFYKSLDQLPPFESYAMDGRTYRYFKGEPLYPFGYGLSYTKFAYSKLVMPKTVASGAPLIVRATVTNVGTRPGDEVVELYVTDVEASVRVPVRSLQGIRRVHLAPGERREVSFTLEPRQLAIVNDSGATVVEPGEFTVAVGGKQPGFKGRTDAATTSVVEGRFRVTGKATVIRNDASR